MGGQEMFPFPFQGQGTWPICIYVVLNFVVNHMTDWVQEEVIGTRSWRTIFHGVPGAEKTQTLKWLRQFFETVCEWTHPQEFVYLAPQNTQADLMAGMCVPCFAVAVHIVAYNITTMQEFFSVPGTVHVTAPVKGVGTETETSKEDQQSHNENGAFGWHGYMWDPQWQLLSNMFCSLVFWGKMILI